MIKFLIGLMVLSQLTWAIPQAMTVCNSKTSYKSHLQLVDKTMSIHLTGIDSTGKPYEGKVDYPVNQNVDFTPADFQAETLDSIYMIADIKAFTSGTWLNVTMGASEGNFYFFEFEPNQFSVVWFIGGHPVALGKTNDCQ